MKDYGLQAIGDRIIVLQDAAPEKSEGGILYTEETKKERPLEGTVVGLGTDEKFHVCIGDRIMFSAWTGDELKAGQAESEKLLVMRQLEVLVVRRASVAASGTRNGAAAKAAPAHAR